MLRIANVDRIKYRTPRAPFQDQLLMVKNRPAHTGIFLRCIVALVIVGAAILLPGSSWSADPAISTPFFSVGLDGDQQPEAPTVVLQIFLLMTVLSLAPAILIMVTSFTRIVIVLSLLRRALGTNQMPPNQVMIGLALFLTFFVMAPVWHKINQNALQPYLDKKNWQ